MSASSSWGPGPGIGLVHAAAAVGPDGHVLGLDPSPVMRQLAVRRCAREIAAGTVEIRDGTAEDTGCPDASVDAALSVNNVMLWHRAAGLAELARVLRPGGRLVVTVHRQVFDVPPERFRDEVAAAGSADVEVGLRPRRRNSRPSSWWPAGSPAADVRPRRVLGGGRAADARCRSGEGRAVGGPVASGPTTAAQAGSRCEPGAVPPL